MPTSRRQPILLPVLRSPLPGHRSWSQAAKTALRWQGTAAWPARRVRWCPGRTNRGDTLAPTIVESSLLNPSTLFLGLSSSACVSASPFSHSISQSFSANRLRADASSDCVPASSVFIQSSYFRVSTNPTCILLDSGFVSVDFWLKYGRVFRAPSISGTSCLFSARPVEESRALSRRLAWLLITQWLGAARNAEQGTEAVNARLCVAESIMTRFRAWRKAVRLRYSSSGFSGTWLHKHTMLELIYCQCR